MDARALEEAALAASRAADRAREETLSRFRNTTAKIKPDGSPVTEADLAAERVIRETLAQSHPDFGLLGEEFGAEGVSGSWSESPDPVWVIDPIDGTIAYARGLPLYSTLIALVVRGESVVGLIDLPALDERYVAWKGGGCRRNGEPVRVSEETELGNALVALCDVACFELTGQREALERIQREARIPRAYTDAFGHSLVLGGGADAMVDLDLNIWDAAASRILVSEAGGTCRVYQASNGKLDLVLGNPVLVERLAGFLQAH